MHTISPNHPHTKSYIQAAPIITEAQLHHYLTHGYQIRIAGIQSVRDRSEGKETGIWDPKERND